MGYEESRNKASFRTGGLTSSQILVVSNQPLARAGYEALLKSLSCYRIAVAPSVDDGLEMASESVWDLLILDLPTLGDLMTVLAALRRRSPGLPILVMCGVPETQIARTILRAGARGYCHKGQPAAELTAAVQMVLAGRRYLNEARAVQPASNVDGDWRSPPHEMLSTRELEVFGRLAAGITVSAIGVELELSLKTVSTYRSRIFQKMGFSSNAEVITYAMRNGLRN